MVGVSLQGRVEQRHETAMSFGGGPKLHRWIFSDFRHVDDWSKWPIGFSEIVKREQSFFPNQEPDDFVGVFRIVELPFNDLILAVAITARSGEHCKWQVRYR